MIIRKRAQKRRRFLVNIQITTNMTTYALIQNIQLHSAKLDTIFVYENINRLQQEKKLCLWFQDLFAWQKYLQLNLQTQTLSTGTSQQNTVLHNNTSIMVLIMKTAHIYVYESIVYATINKMHNFINKRNVKNTLRGINKKNFTSSAAKFQ